MIHSNILETIKSSGGKEFANYKKLNKTNIIYDKILLDDIRRVYINNFP